jgi:murein DD-endopeptidase MepM/ murein hydrolase activator NlpD
VSEKETNLILKKLREKNKKISTLKVNQIIKFTINESNKKVSTVIYPVSKTKKIELIRNAENDSFTRREIITNLKKRIVFKEAIILQSLYKSAVNQSIPANVIVEFARIYGFQVDFQRDIRRNDTFQIIYETFEDEDKKVFTTGNILYADLNLSNQSNSFYYFDLKGEEGHYDLNGKSVKKALMKTPINGARLSSKFGMRKHPIDGYNKMHRGTDFAAPEGTPIMASGDGVIIKAAWCGGGGNCVKIKHNSTYSTVYAHLSKFGGSIKKGKRVKQGQIIGYVGSTGKSTGPHLHYEVIHNGAKINSQKLKLPSGKILKGKARKLFEIKKIKLDVLKSEIIASMN